MSHSIRLKVFKLPMLLQWICIQEGMGAGLGLDQGIGKCFLMYIMWFAGLKKEWEAGDKKAVESGGSCSESSW